MTTQKALSGIRCFDATQEGWRNRMPPCFPRLTVRMLSRLAGLIMGSTLVTPVQEDLVSMLAHSIGENLQAILNEHSFSSDEIDRLINKGVVREFAM